MYERFYQLRHRPFALSPDPDFLYPSRVHREALDYLRFGIEGHAGFIVITGEIGSGKTTLLQVLLRTLDGDTTVIRLVNTLLTGPELIESMLLDLGVANPPASKPAMLRELARVLVEQRAIGRRVVAVIDEAQNLSLGALEELRMLSNLETEKSKLIQVVLVGQPDLRDSLERPSLEQLRQRVTVRYHIDPLDAEETGRYINHRLSRAATAAPLQFSRDVADLVHARSGGVPRMINVICDAVLLFGYAEDRRVIDVPLAQAAIEELESSNVLRRAADMRAKTVAAPDLPGPAAAPAAVATRPAPTPPPSAEDLPLRQTAVTQPATDLSIRQPATFVRSASMNVPTVQAARTSAPGRPPTVTPLRTAQVRQPVPAATFSSDRARRTSGWDWVKTVFLGLGAEAERR
jgi:general secretion pathway protein A